jgi:surfactin synthase thioesterase subunit
MVDLHKLVGAIIDGVGDLFTGRFAFFGYSFGGLVAFELARTLRRLGRQQPEHLFVGATQAPTRLSLRAPIHGLPAGQFLDSIDRRYGLIPAAVRRDPEMLNLVIPVLHADITALETYVYKQEAPLRCAITAFAGTEDASIDKEDVNAWADVTEARFSSHHLPGGHFFIQTQEQQVHRQLRDALLAG